ncbi:thiamine-phosphate pyrophosphorylase [Arcobacter cloacae]
MEIKNKTNSKELVLNLNQDMNENYLRLIDANLNRLREGIRVVEDIFRYVYNDKQTAIKLKELRHLSRLENYIELLETRDVKNDVLRSSIKSEQNRGDLYSILIANFKRAQESSRVLEEFTKLTSIKDSENFKYIRYELYNLEIVLTKITSNSK